MAYVSFTTNEVQVNQPWGADQAQKVKDNFDYLYGQSVEKIGVSNGSFEIDSDSDGVPDGWTKNLYPGGSGGYETTSPAHGAKAYKFTHPGGAGNGGGYLASDYIEIDSLTPYRLDFILWSSVAGLKNIVLVSFFDKAKVNLASDQTIYASVANPTSATAFVRRFTPPSGARYAKIYLIGGYTDTNVAGSSFFDNIVLSPAIVTALYAAGDILLLSADTEGSSSSQTWVKKKEIKVKRKGAIRVKFDLRTSSTGYAAYGKVYRNGVAVGTQRSTTIVVYTTFSEDINDWNPGDLCQLYVYVPGGTGFVYYCNFRVYIEGEEVTLD